MPNYLTPTPEMKPFIEADRIIIKDVLRAILDSNEYTLHFRCSTTKGNRFILTNSTKHSIGPHRYNVDVVKHAIASIEHNLINRVIVGLI
jgi:hypothetical protein